MIIQAFSLGALQTNCYLVYDPISKDAIVIDPADEASFIAEKIQHYNLTLTAIVATHGHFDHALAAGELQLIFPTAPFYMHKSDTFLLKQLNDSASFWLGYKHSMPPPTIINSIVNNDSISVGNYKLKIVHSPGHTPGSICLYTIYHTDKTKYSVLFSGDTLFRQAIGRYDFSYSDKKKLDHSLSLLFKLPPETTVYPGHGEETTIGAEKVYNT